MTVNCHKKEGFKDYKNKLLFLLPIVNIFMHIWIWIYTKSHEISPTHTIHYELPLSSFQSALYKAKQWLWRHESVDSWITSLDFHRHICYQWSAGRLPQHPSGQHTSPKLTTPTTSTIYNAKKAHRVFWCLVKYGTKPLKHEKDW